MGLKFFDLFAGVGGFRLGMERAGHECIGSCEWDKHARETYKKNFGSYPEYDDAKDLHPQSLPYFDVLCAGFPCQAFSIAGKRLGFEDTRGTIFFEIARIAKEKRPSYLFLENVKGLLSHDKGRTFSTIISTLDEMGYDAEWQVLNSKYFVPQNRERIFIVGHLRDRRTRKVFPLGDFNEISDKKKLREEELSRSRSHSSAINANYYKGPDGKRTLVQVGNIDTKGHNSLWGRVYDPNFIGPSLNANGGGMGAKTGLFAIRDETIKPKLLGNIPIPFMKRRNEPKQSDICDYLRNNKNISMYKLALKTQITKTQLEHYFRKDSSGALPNKDDWLKLKKVLNFDDTYDEIMTDYMEDLMTYEMTTRVYDSTGISPTLTSGEKLITEEPKKSEDSKTGLFAIPTLTPDRLEKRQMGRRFKEDGEPAFTLNTQDRHGIFDGTRIRKLTPKECERLQGFPDNWTIGSDTQRYRQCGNAVTVDVVEYIAKELRLG